MKSKFDEKKVDQNLDFITIVFSLKKSKKCVFTCTNTLRYLKQWK